MPNHLTMVAGQATVFSAAPVVKVRHQAVYAAGSRPGTTVSVPGRRLRDPLDRLSDPLEGLQKLPANLDGGSLLGWRRRSGA